MIPLPSTHLCRRCLSKRIQKKMGDGLNMKISFYFMSLLLLYLVVGCDSNPSNEVNEIELVEDNTRLDEKQDGSIDSQTVERYVELISSIALIA